MYNVSILIGLFIYIYIHSCLLLSCPLKFFVCQFFFLRCTKSRKGKAKCWIILRHPLVSNREAVGLRHLPLERWG